MFIAMKILGNLFRRLLRCSQGVATIEFMLVMPIGLVVYFGLMELNTYISTYTKIVETSVEIEDLVGRQATVTCSSTGTQCATSSTFGKIASLASTIVAPTPIAGLTLTITNETLASGATTPTAAWTVSCSVVSGTFICNKNATATIVTLPNSLMTLNVGTGASTDSAAVLSTWSYLIVTATYNYSAVTPITQHITYGLMPFWITLPSISYTKFGFFRYVYSGAVPCS